MTNEVNKRIAKNTLLLYIRTLFSQLLSLYTARKVLEILGIEDYGIYNVVGSVVASLTFLNGSMAIAIQRYLTIEIGKNDMIRYNKVFSMACFIHCVLAFIILLISETIGLWILNSYLNLPESRMFAANCVYQSSVIAMFVGIIQTPYQASITAHEQMDVYAYVGMGETILRLFSVLLLMVINADKLIVYAILLLAIQLTSAMVYRCYCIVKYKECKYHWVWDRYLLRSLLGFTSWNMFGTIAWMLKDQGYNILMNIFGGPLINAARGVSYQVAGALQNLVSGFGTALNPQLTKNYATGQKETLHKLLMTGSKISFFLLLIIALPVMFEINYILRLWLVEVPDHTVWFTRVILIEALCSTLSGSIITSLLATGKIKWYQVVVGSVMLLNIPVSYLLLKCGMPIIIPLWVSLIITIISLVLRLFFCKNLLSLSIRKYLKLVIRPVIIVSIISSSVPLLTTFYFPESFSRLLGTIGLTVVSVLVCLYYLGLDSKERIFISTAVSNKFNHIFK